MPYSSNSELPDSVRDSLPYAAQTIWRESFNSALKQYGSEERATKVAWSVVKKKYKKKGGSWVNKIEKSSSIDDSNDNFSVFCKFTKIDKDNKMVYGYATTDSLDSQDEIVEWDATVNAVEGYSDWRTIKEMHKQDTAVGVAPILEVDELGLFAGAEIVDSEAWEKVEKGVYKGFSIGGKVLKKEIEYDELLGKEIGHIKEYRLDEISLVDKPANPDAKITLAKIDRVDIYDEMRKARVTALEAKRKKLGKTVSEFYAVPRDPPSESKLPIFDVAHVRNAMARFEQTEFVSEDEKNKAKRKILAAAKRFGIKTDKFKKKYGGVIVPKLTKNDEGVEVEGKKAKEEESADKSVEKSPEELLAEKRGISVDDLEKALKSLEKKTSLPSELEKRVSELSEIVEKLSKEREEMKKNEEIEEKVVNVLAKAFSDKKLVGKMEKSDQFDMGSAFFRDEIWNRTSDDFEQNPKKKGGEK